ncbi:aminotransferase class I/II-fold pyridoxal phosphate-dependent enzyme [Microbacterium sp. Au-Mic1]|uniref:MalY/PatB family protein n=1 Tax=Microbacterium sp. Au-Mic1 TaxID=2906457 RepID=UPI001E41BED5|nr:aminotransferase class I/II-fold pyridoxal phosphate-dependent enzyme [Microbacterium sp. Au-Mic1]MCE4027062.1 aminotransferase class I/II-fold pyridoxal phosphate-dependent enzyme [Microbacterium sp. Au-Mic1]
MSTAQEWDAIGIDRLREIGSLKWSVFPEAIGAFVAEMDFPPAPAIAAAMKDAIDDGLTGYLPAAVRTRMTEATARWQKERYGWDVPADRIRAVPDVLTALRATIDFFTEPGSKIVLPTPAYMPFLTIPAMHDREIVEVPMLVDSGRHVYDLEGIDRAFADGGGLLILCNPYNPLGRVFERAELEAVAEVVARHGARVFSDEIHAPLVFAPHRHVPYASISAVTAGHTITAASASKAFNLPGLKAAQVILTNDADAETWARPEVAWAEHGTANLGVIATTAAFDDSRDWLDDTLDYLDGNRRLLGELLAEHIPGMGYRAPEGTYIAWLDARALGIEGSPAAFFREHAGVAMTDGIACGAAGEGYLRFILATPRPVIEQAVRQMAAALCEHDAG